MRKSIANRRYYYHRKLRQLNIPVDPDTRSINIPYQSFKEIPVGPRYYVGQLIKMGYNIQLKLL